MRDIKQRKDMERENCKALLPIMQAYAEGKTIEIYDSFTEKWQECPEPKFDNTPERYRVREENPTQRFRACADMAEFMYEAGKHQPHMFVMADGELQMVIVVRDTGIVTIKQTYTWKEALEQGVTFADGTPIGRELMRMIPEDKKKYRPFRHGCECFEEMHRHPDFGYVMRNHVFLSVWDIYSDAIHTSEDCDECLCFEDALKEVTFTDGKPFGKEVAE